MCADQPRSDYLPGVTVLAGHYGSGKTTVAVAMACAAAREGCRVTLCDLDTVNPYYRAADYGETLAALGVTLLSPPFANTNVEATWLPPGLEAALGDSGMATIIDAGGDDAGALVLGRYAQFLQGARMLMVANAYRPLTRDAQSLLFHKHEIERASGLRFVGVIDNSNLGAQTTPQTRQAAAPVVRAFAKLAKLPVIPCPFMANDND